MTFFINNLPSSTMVFSIRFQHKALLFLKIKPTKNQGVSTYSHKAGNQHITNQ